MAGKVSVSLAMTPVAYATTAKPAKLQAKVRSDEDQLHPFRNLLIRNEAGKGPSCPVKQNVSAQKRTAESFKWFTRLSDGENRPWYGRKQMPLSSGVFVDYAQPAEPSFLC